MRSLFIIQSGVRRRTIFQHGASLDAAYEALVQSYYPGHVPAGRHVVFVRANTHVVGTGRDEVRVVAEYLFDADEDHIWHVERTPETLVDPDDIDW